MALPAGVIVALGELVTSPKVRDFATKLVKDVYGKIMPSEETGDKPKTPEQGPLTLEDIAARVEDLPSKQELIAAFAVLQAELEREHQKTHRWLRAVIALQLLVLLGIVGIVVTS